MSVLLLLTGLFSFSRHRCRFATFKQCQEWVKRLNRAIAPPSRLEDLFALAYHAWCLGGSADDEDQHVHLCRPGDHVGQRVELEVKRMGFDTQNIWRVSDINSNYKLCSSYPQKLLVPIWITDKELESVASFRSWKRIPVVVYRHQRNGAVIARCSQPEISWWGWRNTDDEYLVTSIAKACQMGTKGAWRQRGEAPESCDSDFDSSLTGGSGCDDSTVPQKLLILDARSYTAAVANRAKGGGCECEGEAEPVLQPVCHTRALQLWTAVYLPTSSPCTAVDDSMELYLPPSAAGEELSSRSLDRLPKTRSMDNLLSAFENGLPLTRTSSDPNLNQHCQEGPSAPEPPAAPDHAPAGLSDGLLPDAPLDSSASPDSESCADPPEDPCLTTQPLPSQPLPSPPLPSPPLPPAPLSDPLVCQQITHPAVPPSSESPSRTAESAALPSREWEPSHPLPCSTGLCRPAGSEAGDPLLLMEDSLRLSRGGGPSPTPPSTAEPPSRPAEEPRSQLRRDEEDAGAVKEGKHLPASSDSTQNASGPLVSQSHLSDLSILGSHWDSILVQSAYSQSGVGRVLQPSSYQMRRPGSRLARGQGLAPSRGPQCCCREAPCPGGPQPGPHHSSRSGPAISLNGFSVQGHQIPPTSYAPPSASCSPPPPQAPAYLDDDGLPVPLDAVQQRLRQIEAGYKQEVEVLRQQVRQLQMRLESKQYSRPPSEPDVDYEDDITCLRESDHSNEEDSLSTHSEDRLSEGSWDRVEPKDTEVTRWVPDHMASHCFSCDCEFWIAKRRHHCRNCGNVFCKDCCHLKLPIPDQQLYDPVLVCNACHDLLLESRTREIRSQQLKKAIATASS
eukprot:XP_011618942.1 PREDICTED: myotubularin-related protein 4-like [Takifugu rubripes]